MYDHSNIEIINFEPFADNQMNHYLDLPYEDFGFDKLGLLDKLDRDMYDPWSSFDSIQQSNSFCCFTNGESFSSCLSNDNLSCYSDCTSVLTPTIVLEKDTNISFDNCTESKSSKKFRTFACTSKGCTKVYKSKENLTLHFKNIHLKEKPYSCKYCDAVFSHRNGKTYHERKFHTKYLPHKCCHEGKLVLTF
jgi:hypothetical protein